MKEVNFTTEKELKMICKNKEKIQAMKAEIDDLTYKSTVGSQQLTGMPFVSGTSDKVGDYVTRITDLQDRCISLMIRNQRLIRKAKRFIRMVPDDTIQTILFMRYIIGKDELDIADAMGMKYYNREKQIKSIIKTFFLDCLLYM